MTPSKRLRTNNNCSLRGVSQRSSAFGLLFPCCFNPSDLIFLTATAVSSNITQSQSSQSLAPAGNVRNAAQMLQQARKIGVETALKNRKPNTTRAYSTSQKLWERFCADFAFEDGEFVSPDKLLLFTQQVVMTATVKPRQKGKGKGKRRVAEEERGSASSSGDDTDEDRGDRHDRNGRAFEVAADVIDGVLGPNGQGSAPLKYNTAKGYITGITDLYNQQIARGDHTYPNPRGFGVRGHLKDLRAGVFQRLRSRHEDRAIGSILDAYTPEVLTAFVKKMWSGKRSIDQRLRTLVDFLVGHHFLLRGQLRRSAEFADMFLMEFPKEGPQRCYCWILMIDNGKTNDTGKRQYLGAMRHKDVLLCSQGALAQYLYYRFHVAAEKAWPDFKSPALWDTIKLLRGGTKDPTHPLDDTTQRKWIRGTFEEIGYAGTQTSHSGRKSGAQWAEIAGVSEEEVSRLRWPI
jgi:hypothetical protein